MKTFSTQNKIQKTLSFGLLALALMGCGPRILDNGTEKSGVRSPDSYEYYALGNYNCPTEQNVLPYEDRLFDGTQRYTVCSHKTSAAKIQISGFSSTEASVCVFPLQFLDDTHFVYKVGTNGLPFSMCYNAQTARTKELEFQLISYNGVAIVDQSDQADLSRCLMYGQSCPNYSLGQFR